MQVPLDNKLNTLPEIPYTISYVIRKRSQIDSINEIPKEKRPPDDILWDGTPEELEAFLDKVFKGKENNSVDLVFADSEIES